MSKKALIAAMVQAQGAISDMYIGIGVHNERHTPKIDGPVVSALGHAYQALRDAIEKDASNPTVTKLSADDELVKFMEGVVGVVEANSFEQHCLWKENHFLEDDARHKREWKDNTSGMGETIGYVDGRPVAISLRTAIIDGHKIMFYYATSNVIDHKMICEWLLLNLPDTAKVSGPAGYNTTDATNFHNIFPRG